MDIEIQIHIIIITQDTICSHSSCTTVLHTVSNYSLYNIYA